MLITKGAELDSAPLFIFDVTMSLTGVPVFRVRSTHFIFFAQNAFFVKCVDLTLSLFLEKIFEPAKGNHSAYGGAKRREEENQQDPGKAIAPPAT